MGRSADASLLTGRSARLTRPIQMRLKLSRKFGKLEIPVKRVVLMKRKIQVMALGTTLSMASLMASGAEVSSTALTLDPAYDVAGCALATSNGYAGTDRQLFIPTVDGYYSVKD